MFGRPCKVKIIYRNGQTMTLRCDAFTVRKVGAEIRGVEWDNPWPKPLHLGVDEVVAVWEL